MGTGICRSGSIRGGMAWVMVSREARVHVESFPQQKRPTTNTFLADRGGKGSHSLPVATRLVPNQGTGARLVVVIQRDWCCF